MRRGEHYRVRGLLARGMTHAQRRLQRRLIDTTYARFLEYQRKLKRDQRRAAQDVPLRSRKKWRQDLNLERRKKQHAPLRALVDFLRYDIDRQLTTLRQMFALNAEFRRSYARVVDQQEADRLILDYAAELGWSRWRRHGDERALRRWFDDEALNDRFLAATGERELGLMFLVERFGLLVGRVTRVVSQRQDAAEAWVRIGVDGIVRDVLAYSGDRRIQTSAVKCLKSSLARLSSEAANRIVSVDVLASVQRFATDAACDVGLQCVSIDVLRKLDPELHQRVIEQRLRQPLGGDDLFVRRHCLRQVQKHPMPFLQRDSLWTDLHRDPSDAVRQQLVETLWRTPLKHALPHLQDMANDEAPKVRAMVYRAGLEFSTSPRHVRPFVSMMRDGLRQETDPFVQRVLLHVATRWLSQWRESRDSLDDPRYKVLLEHVHEVFLREILPEIRQIQASAPSVESRRWAAAAAEMVWVRLDTQSSDLFDGLAPYVGRLMRRTTVRVPSSLVRAADPARLGRTLAALTQDTFGLELRCGTTGYFLVRQPNFGFRWWRTWFEFCRPATDKRQAHRHTIGRISRSTFRVPSRIMGELSQTKVPGEPLVIANDSTWRPFLPLPDDFISCLNQSWLRAKDTRIYSSEGVTEIRVDRRPWRRLWGAIKLTLRLPRIAELRNWDGNGDPQVYLSEVKRYGLDTSFRPHNAKSAANDESVTSFFPGIILLGSGSLVPALWGMFRDYAYYFGSAFENTLGQLVLFTACVLIGFVIVHALRNVQIARARRSFPISIGGWGTRGKSGTERLKAALLCATGHGIVSKTTGCEAMFIHSYACGAPLEIPLYRPGDKATIWEQSQLLKISRQLRPSAFLWECMALSPSYVDVLQRQWMNDDLATITNTYPDHEDLQGPSGFDVASTIAGFVPIKSRVITTEREMLPVLRMMCERVGSSLRSVGWLESGLIADDFLNRFPYQEHPDNIALVAAMAEELGLDFDFSVRAMADYLIPDLGVLKTHPVADVDHASIEFTNGMSANERFGCLGNWKRMGFDSQDPHESPEVWISTVINNRADRVARSRVFASIVVNDIRVDRHVLIGSNLKGLQGMIWEAWAEFAAQQSLGSDPFKAKRTVLDAARKFRVPDTDEQVRRYLQPMVAHTLSGEADNVADAIVEETWQDDQACRQALIDAGGAANDADRVQRHHQRLLEEWSMVDELCELVDTSGRARVMGDLDSKFREVLRDWMANRIVVIDDVAASGDEIIQRIIDETPPGYTNRAMGLQNIKGTGLDFVYRFQAWDTCHAACELVEQADSSAQQAGLAQLDGLAEFGCLGQRRVAQALDSLADSTGSVAAELQLQFDSIRSKLAGPNPTVPAEKSHDWKRRPWVAWILSRIEEWMEVQDALRRRRDADVIYNDLQFGRIGRQRAVRELRRINKRQKGGWLSA